MMSGVLILYDVYEGTHIWRHSEQLLKSCNISDKNKEKHTCEFSTSSERVALMFDDSQRTVLLWS